MTKTIFDDLKFEPIEGERPAYKPVFEIPTATWGELSEEDRKIMDAVDKASMKQLFKTNYGRH